jgi:acetyl esterase/lipase
MTPAKLRQAIRDIGDEFSFDVIMKCQALYGRLHKSAPPVNAVLARDVKYGADARHRLDVYRPKAKTKRGRPVLLFVHGGGFVAGDKTQPGGFTYDNIAKWAVSQGFVGVNMTYRLAPTNPYPAGAEDVAAAIHWAHRKIAEYGGDKKKIFLMGQSAGAAHVADYIATPSLHKVKGGGIAAGFLISGIFDLVEAEHDERMTSYYGTDPSLYAKRSSLKGLTETKIPLLFSLSEFDPWDFQNQAALVTNAFMKARKKCARLLYLLNHNHLTSTLQLGVEPDTLGPELKTLMDDVSAGIG